MDVSPDIRISQQKLRAQIAQQRATVESQRLAIMEMAERKSSHIRNISAAETAIEKMEFDLKRIEEAHGRLTEEEISSLIKSLELNNG